MILSPTMLMDTEHGRRMQKKPVMKLEDEFILVYSLGGLTGEVSQYIERVAKQHECKVLDMLAGRTKELYLARPDEFLYLIQHAKLVVTDSFHATVFSILFHTDFFVFNRKETKEIGNMTSRLDTLLEVFSYCGRRVGEVEDKDLFGMEFSHIPEVLHNEVNEKIRI